MVLFSLTLNISPSAQGVCKDNEEFTEAFCGKACERTCTYPDANCLCDEPTQYCRCAKGFVRGDNDQYPDGSECVAKKPFCDGKPCVSSCD
ncbi:hypothetical protein DdX_13562 [Ditylenchus destructor]|uniref:TIL domain-containing protein n=1 Tax=Ditylenchus destructor TaxID=166010 RepID=A0AAD4QZG7_9BILA|nr:hypothetical protein DdX_13562 [Ditylenchus destructor]